LTLYWSLENKEYMCMLYFDCSIREYEAWCDAIVFCPIARFTPIQPETTKVGNWALCASYKSNDLESTSQWLNCLIQWACGYKIHGSV